jgi:hypothetical protein
MFQCAQDGDPKLYETTPLAFLGDTAPDADATHLTVVFKPTTPETMGKVRLELDKQADKWFITRVMCDF